MNEVRRWTPQSVGHGETGTMAQIRVEISNDLGDWEGVEHFLWDAYGSELKAEAQKILGIEGADAVRTVTRPG